MITSGRCHGPGCTQTAVVEFWCGERCQQVWSAQFGKPALMVKMASWADPATVERLRRQVAGLAELRDSMRAAGAAAAGVSTALDPVEREVEEVDDLPSMAESGVDTPGCDCGHAGMAAGWHATACGWFTPEGAAYPQVASNPDPQVGWLARLFDRLFGRTT